MKHLAKQSILVMGWSVVGSQVVAMAVVQALAPDFLDTAMKISPIVSALVAIPLTYAFMRQNALLAEANEKLEIANDKLGQETAIAKREASLDPMTNIFNRVHFVKEIEQRRSAESEQGYFLMLDADNFKTINDNYGHLVGDSVLIRITEIMQSALRSHDIAGRLGGEEFGIYLRGVTYTEAYEIAERIRSRVAKTEIDIGPDQYLSVTVSIGAVFAAAHSTVTELMRVADKNLYEAKDRGRNNIVFDAQKFSECVSNLKASA